MNVAELIQLLQDLNLPEPELDELTERLTAEGLTEPVRRRVRATLMRVANREFQALEKDERAYDILKRRDETVATIKQRTEQALNRADLQTTAKLEILNRHVTEDVAASKAGATLLLHTDDVAVAPVATPELATSRIAVSPKAAAAAVIEAAKQGNGSSVSPISAPSPLFSPSLPTLPKGDPVPATMAPLPPTPIAPPAVDLSLSKGSPIES